MVHWENLCFQRIKASVLRNVLCGFSLEEQRNFMKAGVLKTRLHLIFASLERCGTLASIY
ncbi:hypothetical protein V6Z11_A05G048000 [Gossypium hirsutum]